MGWKWQFLIMTPYRNLHSCNDVLYIAGRGHRGLSNDMSILTLDSRSRSLFWLKARLPGRFWDTFDDRTATKPTFPRAPRSLVFQCTGRFVDWASVFNGSRSKAKENLEGEKRCDRSSSKISTNLLRLLEVMKLYWNAGQHEILHKPLLCVDWQLVCC